MWGWGWGTSGHSRRDVLRLGLGVLGAMCLPRSAFAARTEARSISLYAVHTGESLSADYMVGGEYQEDALAAIADVLRDHYTDDVHPIDPGVLDILNAVQGMLGDTEAFHVVSGYRSPETNEWKRRRSRHSGVARDSFHLYGRAIDLFLPRCDLRQVRRAALSLAAGGVGYYPQSNFVHLDSGPFRMW